MAIKASVYLEFIENHLPTLKAGRYPVSYTHLSVRVDELTRCRAEILKLNLPNQWPMPGLGPNVPSRSLIYTLAGYLRVSFNYLIWFLSNLGPTALEGLPVPAVLLESSFVVPLLDANLQVELKGKQYTCLLYTSRCV